MRYLTAGFSHGTAYTGIIEGLPSGLMIDEGFINAELMKRQSGYGRSGRMEIERDTVKFISGLIEGKTTGAPVAFTVRNLMHDLVSFTVPRPGHADLNGAIKYGFTNLSLVAESASGRETVMAAVIGAICKLFLSRLSISISGTVLNIFGETDNKKFSQIIDDAARDGDTVGGRGQVVVSGIMAGLGSHVARDRRLDSRLAGAVMGIPSVKAVEFGLGRGFESALGSQSMDAISVGGRLSNNAGGIEGGITSGQDIVICFTVKPVPTVGRGAPSVDLATGQPSITTPLRSDVCIVPSVVSVAESVTAYEILNEILFCLGGDTVDEVIERYNAKKERADNIFTPKTNAKP